MTTEDLRIVRTRPLLTPAILAEELPLGDAAARIVTRSRAALVDILDGRDPRPFVVVGPCSVHDPAAALVYAEKLRILADEVADSVFLVMRVYFEKPRTIMGWKGLINDPDIDGSYRINEGLRRARKLLVDVADLGLPAGTEFLDTTFGQFFADLISWAAIGARTVESQVHRELASGLSMPVGMKNRTDGNVQVAVEAILAARERHLFPSLTHEGAPAILETSGNPDCHLVLRGGSVTGPNHDADSVAAAVDLLTAADLPARLMIDCSHANSGKDPNRQPELVAALAARIAAGQTAVRALMIESHLVAGRQEPTARPLTFGQSITDACLDFDTTRECLLRFADALR
ncbi:MAG: 3-deoxy-7-phosphoheptulonate synthase [Gammaproteobacteria bacterium]|nr:MAG: 3-deoxy-7-phosphoheptulonate synthase [Gammaproteobacteria bacterium]